MTMPQIVGLKCVACQKSINTVAEGSFCGACGNPIHAKCFRQSPASEAIQTVEQQLCSQCGGDPRAPVAMEVRSERKNPTFRPAGGAGGATEQSVNISKVGNKCPNCGGTSFGTVRPESFIAFAKDRICTNCNTRYSPPTPLWAGVVFLLAGIVLAGFGGFAVLGHLSSQNPVAIPAMACEGFLGVLGVLSIVHAIRTFLQAGAGK